MNALVFFKKSELGLPYSI